MIAIPILLVAVILFLGVLRWASGGRTLHVAHGSGIIESIPDAREQYPMPSHSLSLMSFNLGYCLGTHDHAGIIPDASTIYDRLDHVVETIAGSGAEVVLLQAVDFRSRRTHDVDQLHYIAAALGWGFAARALTWECRYVPYPIWPFGQPAGPVQAGMGVVSRFPLLQNMRQCLPQPSSLRSFRFRPFDLIQLVDMQYGAQTVRLFNVHPLSGQAEGELAQARAMVTFVQQKSTPNSVLMGSFNAATESANKAMNFIVDGLSERMLLIGDKQLSSPHMTPNSRLGHVFVASGLKHLQTEVLLPQEQLARDLPLLTHLRWQLPMLTQDGRNSHERL